MPGYERNSLFLCCDMTFTPPSPYIRDHGRIHPRAYRHLPHQCRAQRLLRATQTARYQRLAHCGVALILARLSLPRHVHGMLPDPQAESDVGRFPAASRTGSAKLRLLSQAGSPRHSNGRIGMVRLDTRPYRYVPGPVSQDPVFHCHRCSSNCFLCRVAFEIVALAAARLGTIPLAAQSVIMSADQSSFFQHIHLYSRPLISIN